MNTSPMLYFPVLFLSALSPTGSALSDIYAECSCFLRLQLFFYIFWGSQFVFHGRRAGVSGLGDWSSVRNKRLQFTFKIQSIFTHAYTRIVLELTEMSEIVMNRSTKTTESKKKKKKKTFQKGKKKIWSRTKTRGSVANAKQTIFYFSVAQSSWVCYDN